MVKLVMCAPGKTGKILRTALALAICKNWTNGTNQNFLEAERVCFVFDWVTSELEIYKVENSYHWNYSISYSSFCKIDRILVHEIKFLFYNSMTFQRQLAVVGP